MANFAIKDAMDVKIKVLGESSPKMVIDYLNESSLALEMDTNYARIKGNNAVPFNGSRTGITY